MRPIGTHDRDHADGGPGSAITLKAGTRQIAAGDQSDAPRAVGVRPIRPSDARSGCPWARGSDALGSTGNDPGDRLVVADVLPRHPHRIRRGRPQGPVAIPAERDLARRRPTRAGRYRSDAFDAHGAASRPRHRLGQYFRRRRTPDDRRAPTESGCHGSVRPAGWYRRHCRAPIGRRRGPGDDGSGLRPPWRLRGHAASVTPNPRPGRPRVSRNSWLPPPDRAIRRRPGDRQAPNHPVRRSPRSGNARGEWAGSPPRRAPCRLALSITWRSERSLFRSNAFRSFPTGPPGPQPRDMSAPTVRDGAELRPRYGAAERDAKDRPHESRMSSSV